MTLNQGNGDGGQVRTQQGQSGEVPAYLNAPNGEIIAASQGSETKANAEKGIQAIKTHAANAKIEDHSET
jgi:uncharacterized protein